MRVAARIFWLLAAFFLIVTVAYGLLTGVGMPLGIELVGFPAFIMLILLFGLLAITMQVTSKKYQGQPEEDAMAEVSEQAGVQGSFAPYSWWPLWLALGGAAVFLGVAVGWWIAGIGAVVAIVGIIGWAMEYNRGVYEH